MRLGAGPYLYSIITYPMCKFFSRRPWRLLARGGFAGHPHPAGGLAALLHLPPKKLAHGVNILCKRTCVSAGIEAVLISGNRGKRLLNYPPHADNGSTT